MLRRQYPSDLTDVEGKTLEPRVPAVQPGGRPARQSRRELVNAMLSVVRGGISWRAMPHDLPPWQTVSCSFRRGKMDGVWEVMNAHVRIAVRERAGRSAEPSAAILDRQRAKTTEKGGFAAGTERSA